MDTDLLKRDDFRRLVFVRDGHRCVICGEPAKDAHHIIERKLWPDGGYWINNGAALCEKHHLEAEMTTLSCEEIRAAAGIKKVVLPPHMYDDQITDKWGNPILPNGQRMRGELFDDPNVQKILNEAGVLNQFTKYVKYPRTTHVPWSPGITSDDRVLRSLNAFEGQRVIVTVKMDGENTTAYNDYIHARSRADRKHWSRSWVKNFHAMIRFDIPHGWRVCLKNLYAKHAIKYKDLASYVCGLSIWNDRNICLSWDETLEWFQLLGIKPVPVLYDGIWDEALIREIYRSTFEGNDCEGYVVRVADSFHYSEFPIKVGKYVRKGHVPEDEHHWFGRSSGETNELAKT